MRYIQFKVKKELHDSGYRFLIVQGDCQEDLGKGHDHILIRSQSGTKEEENAIHIDVTKNGWIRIKPYIEQDGKDEDWQPNDLSVQLVSGLTIERKKIK